MRIGIAGPIATESIAHLLGANTKDLPRGYAGAPLLGTLIGALLERGHSVVAYTTSADLPLSGHVKASGDRFKITFCPARRRAFRYGEGHWGRAADAFKHERIALRQAMLDDAPDLVHAHWTYEFALAAIESGLPHLVTCHDAPQVVLKYSPNLYRLVRYFMAKQVLSQARNLTAVSPYLQQKVQGYAQAPVAVIPNPLPEHAENLGAYTRQYDPGCPRIAMVLNGWGARKNPQPALRAFAAFRQKIPAAELVIMGSDYGAGGKAESWAKSKGLADGVHFMGPQPYASLLSKLAESDLLLHPAREETFGMSIAEAMSLGVPVIGGRESGAVPWVIANGGVVVDVTSANAIETAMMGLLSQPEVHLRHARAAKKRVSESFSASKVAEAYECIYSGILRGAGGLCDQRLTA